MEIHGYLKRSTWLLALLNLLIKQGKDKTAEERRIAICVFDDVVEHCREAALK
jgi:hypothetical protein